MTIKFGIILIYMAILALIGIFSAKKINALSDFYVGGKKLGYWVVAFSARATGESGWLLLGLTGMGAMMGLKAFWVVIGEVLGVTICWLFMAKKFKWLTDRFESITVPDYLSSRFQTKTHTLRLLSALILMIFITIYVSAQIDATGSAFEMFFGWNYFVGALVGFGIVVTYISFGGFVAVAWSDLFQGIMMLIGLVLLPIVAYFVYHTQFDVPLLSHLSSLDPGLGHFLGSEGLELINIFGIIGFLTIGIGFLGSPQIFVRFISVKDNEEIEKGTYVAIAFTILTDSAAVLTGMFGRALLTSPGQKVTDLLGNGAQNVLPLLVEFLFSPFLIGLYIATVLAAIMSTIDSLLVVASSAFTRDIYQQIWHPNHSKPLTKLSRNVTIIMAFIALAIALIVATLSPTRTIFWFVIFGWSGIAATFCPSIILSLFWSKFTEKGAIASMIAGGLAVPFFQFFAVNIPVVGTYLKALSTLPPSIAVAILTGVIVSKIKPDTAIQQWYHSIEANHKEPPSINA